MKKKIPKPFFALSGNELGKRLGTTRSIAGTLLTQLASILIIQIQEKGEAWTAGKNAKANLWEKWMLPL